MAGAESSHPVDKGDKADVVHAHMPISGFIARVAALYCRVPCIAYTCHGFLFNQPGPVWRKLLSFTLEWVAGQWTDIFMTVSEEEAHDARRWRINRHPVANLNGRDPQRFRPDPAARQVIRDELGVDNDMVVILAVSVWCATRDILSFSARWRTFQMRISGSSAPACRQITAI